MPLFSSFTNYTQNNRFNFLSANNSSFIVEDEELRRTHQDRASPGHREQKKDKLRVPVPTSQMRDWHN